MDYKSFINGMAMQSGQTSEDVDATVKALVDILGDCFCKLDSVAIPAFGTFKPEKHDEYIAPDPEDGSLTCYPPSITLSFKPSAMLKKRFSNE